MAKELSLMVIAGEASGDLHAGNLCRRLLQLHPGVKLYGMGGTRMESAGVELVNRIGRTAVVGFWEVFKDIGRYRKIFHHLVNVMEERRPDAVVLIDYPGFNIRFARQAHSLGIRVIYYISPQVWAWGRRRIKKLERLVDKMVVIFEFEKKFYQPYNLDVEFVGHPLVDTLGTVLSKEEARKHLGLNQGTVIGLLPGSRRSELERLLPVMLKTGLRIQNQLGEVTFVLPLASPLLRQLVLEYLEASPLPVKLFEGKAQTVLAASDLAIVASGTATLDAAAFLTPMIIIYKINFFSWLLIRFLIKIPYIGLVNVISGSKIVPEYIQFKARPGLIAKRAVTILAHPDVREGMISRLHSVRESLGKPGASLRAARAVLAATGTGDN